MPDSAATLNGRTPLNPERRVAGAATFGAGFTWGGVVVDWGLGTGAEGEEADV